MQLLEQDVIVLDLSHLVTEDDTPVDNPFSSKQQRLLVDAIYDDWERVPHNDFWADANVGVFPSLNQPPLVPDMFLSVDVTPPPHPWPKRCRAYFNWEHGKPPDVVIEIVSNREGEERGRKHRDYARMGVPYYVVFDPLDQLGAGQLQILELDTNSGRYQEHAGRWLPRVELGLGLWEGTFQGLEARWLRWCRSDGTWLRIGAEQARNERRKAAAAKKKAAAAKKRATAAEERAAAAERRARELEARLRALGEDPG